MRPRVDGSAVASQPGDSSGRTPDAFAPAGTRSQQAADMEDCILWHGGDFMWRDRRLRLLRVADAEEHIGITKPTEHGSQRSTPRNFQSKRRSPNRKTGQSPQAREQRLEKTENVHDATARREIGTMEPEQIDQPKPHTRSGGGRMPVAPLRREKRSNAEQTGKAKRNPSGWTSQSPQPGSGGW